MNKLKNIELLRCIGCLAIVCLHLFNENIWPAFPDINVYKRLATITVNGNKAVDLFFLLAGLFFALHFNREQPMFDFMKKKIIRLYPVVLLIAAVSFSGSLFGLWTFDVFSVILILFNIFGTAMNTGISGAHIGVFWYVSAMLWVLGIYYYLFKNYNRKTVNLIIFLAVFFCYSFLICAKNGKFNRPQLTFYYVFNVGFMRAVGGIGIGCLIGEWWADNSEKIKQKTLNIWQQSLITIVEFICLYFMVKYLLFQKIKFKNDMIFIVDFAVLIVLFLSKKGFLSQLLNDTPLGNIWLFFGKYTYSIYMVHKLIFAFFRELQWRQHPEFIHAHPFFEVIIILCSLLMTGILIYHLVEKPAAEYLSKKKE